MSLAFKEPLPLEDGLVPAEISQPAVLRYVYSRELSHEADLVKQWNRS